MTSLQERTSRKRRELIRSISGATELTMKTVETPTHYTHSLFDQTGQVVGTPINVPLTHELKAEIPGFPADGWEVFFRNLGCLRDGNIDMTKVNEIKQALDWIKDGTHKDLLKKFRIWDFGNRWQHIKYPDTLHFIEVYFIGLFKSKGMCTDFFWPRHGDNTSIDDADEMIKVDCGPDSVELVHHKAMSDHLDPLPHGVIKPYDVVFPSVGIEITWESGTLRALGFPPGCAITAKCLGDTVGTKSEWDICVTCVNLHGHRISADSKGIYKVINGKKTKIETKAIKNLDHTIRGNAFKSLTQKGELEIQDTLLINMLLGYNKSWGDNGFFLEQKLLAILGVNASTNTCDKVLFTTVVTAMIQSGAILTTNHIKSDGGPTGNLSTRFRATEISPERELRSIFDSCLFENTAYLQMLKRLYNDARSRAQRPTIQIKLGGETHDVNLWFLVTIIKTIEEMLHNHTRIMIVFTRNAISQPQFTEEWREHKQYILQLLKSYCKIVFPFVKKNNGEWTVFCQSSLISKFPATQAADNVQITSLISECAELNENNKNALTKQMNLVLTENVISITIGKISMQQYALIVKKYFNHSHTEKLPEIAAAQGGGGRNMRRDNIKIGGMDPQPPSDDEKDREQPTSEAEEEDEEEEEEEEEGVLGKRGDSLPGPADGELPIPTHKKNYTLSEATTRIFNIEHFKTDIAEIQISVYSPRSLDLNSDMGFSPKAFCDDDNINTEIFKLIMLSDFLSQILKLISYIITLGINNEIDAAAEAGEEAGEEAPAVLEHQYRKCIAAMGMVRNNKLGNSNFELWGLAHSLKNITTHQQPDVLGHLYSDIQFSNDLVIKKLTDAGFNPSSNTIEVAITSFNLSIREILSSERVAALHEEYYRDQRTTISTLKGHLDDTTITELEKMMTAEYRTSLYENILNIAYNVVLNHEYFLPLTCSYELFNECFRKFIDESQIDLRAGVTAVTVEPATGPIASAAVPSSPSPPKSRVIQAVSNAFNSQLSSSQGSLSQGSLSPSPEPTQEQRDYFNTLISPLLKGRGGSSIRTRTRRKLRRNHRRTQYTNKNKRSSKSTKYNTIKHRKSYRKHNRTIKRRKNSRRRK